METILGIDLGTTNSEVSIIRDKEIIVVEKDGRKLLPSVVGIDLTGNLLVGYSARNQAILYPERTVKSIKRLMGEKTKIKLGNNEYSPPEISAMILKTLKNNAEETFDQKFSKAVITVPAFFNDTQREATRLAGELAGLEVVRIINEPTAASLCYETDEPNKISTDTTNSTDAKISTDATNSTDTKISTDATSSTDAKISTDNAETILVYDIGGGTFDVSIVRVEKGVIEVLASHGDTKLGGDDFDQLLFDHVCNNFEKLTKVDLRKTPTAVSRVMQAVEAAKIELSDNPLARIKEEFIAEKDSTPLHLDIEIQRTDYERMIFPLLDKTITCLNEALEDANLRPSNIDKIIMVGGASRTPLIHSLIENRMGMTPHGEIDPDLCVTMGAAIQGGLIAGTEVGRVLVDITPHTLGIHAISTSNQYSFSPLIKRNTPVPCKKSEMYYKKWQGQKEVYISIYQGEHGDIRQNTLIGEFIMEGLSVGELTDEILCQFELDVNGILHVTATEKITGLTSDVYVQNALSQLEPIANEQFKDHLNQLFHEQPTSADATSNEDKGNELKPEDFEGLDTELLSDALKLDKKLTDQQIYLDELNTIRKGVKLLVNKLPTNASDVESLIRKLIQAINQDNKEETKKLSTELEDMIYYLDDPT